MDICGTRRVILLCEVNNRFHLPNPRPIRAYAAPAIPPELYGILGFIAGTLAEWVIHRILDKVSDKKSKRIGFTDDDREKIGEAEKRLEQVEDYVKEIKEKVDTI